MSKKLWKIKVEYHLVVLADDAREAKKQTLQSWADMELNERSSNNMSVVCEIKTLGAVPPGWMDRVPYAKHLSRLLEGVSVKEFIQRRLFNPFTRVKTIEFNNDHNI